MRIITLSMFVIIFLNACASTSLQGRIENERYFAPNGKIVFTPPKLGGLEHSVRDHYNASIDRGFLEEADAFGLQGMYYTSIESLGVSQPSNTDERRSILNKGMTNFVMPNIFLTASPNAEVLYQEFVTEQGKEMILALVRLPESSGAYDLATNKKFDAYPAILVLEEGGYVIVLRVQSNLTDLGDSEPKDMASNYLGKLRKLKSGLEVLQ